MTNFKNWINHKAINKTAQRFAIARELELTVYRNTDTEDPEHNVEIWPYDDSQEAPYVEYAIQSDGSLYMYRKNYDVHKELHKVEDLPITIKSVKELNAVVAYIAECLS